MKRKLASGRATVRCEKCDLQHNGRGASQIQKGRGFTLIELMVVIAIIAILAALLLPRCRGRRRRLCLFLQKSSHQMGLALGMYIGDFHAYPPYESYYPDAGRSHHWSFALWPYYHLAWTNTSFHCPAYKGYIGEDLDDAEGWGSYGYNTFGVALFQELGLDAPLLAPLTTNHGRRGPALKESMVVMPSEMFAIMDARAFNEGPGPFSLGWMGRDWIYCFPSPIPVELMQPPQHGKGFNVLFCDGHVAFLKFTDLFNPTNTAQNWNNDHQPHPETWR